MQQIQVLLLRRLSRYLLTLKSRKAKGEKIISSATLGALTSTHCSQVRRDMGILGVVGQPRIGTNIGDIIKAIEKFLGINTISSAFLVGVGNVGKALLKSENQNTGVEILAGFDTDISLYDTKINQIKIYPLEKFAPLARKMNVQIGIICTPLSVAQETAELMVSSGIKGIWNFTPTKLEVPNNIFVETVNLYSGLTVLSWLVSGNKMA